MRTCAIWGAELPEGLRHGAKYCPHGRCKTKAYRERKKEHVQKCEPTGPQQAASASRGTPPNSPLIFTHAIACTCGQQPTVQILISQAQTGEHPFSVPATQACVTSGASAMELDSSETPDRPPTARIGIAPTAPSESVQSAAGLDVSMAAALPVEQSALAMERRAQDSATVVVLMEPTSPELPERPPTARISVDPAAPSESMQSAAGLDASMAAPLPAEQSVLAMERRAQDSAAVDLPAGTPELSVGIRAGKEALCAPAVSSSLPAGKDIPSPEVPEPSADIAAETAIRPSALRIDSAVSGAAPESPLRASAPAPSVSASAAAFGTDFWRLAKERPTEALEIFYRLLERGYVSNDPQLVERAYCGMALVYALRSDGARAAERLGHARRAAARRGNVSEVESVAQQLDSLLSVNKA